MVFSNHWINILGESYGLLDYIVSPSPIPFPLDFGFWILDLDFGPGFWTWILDLDFGLGFWTGLGLDNCNKIDNRLLC